MENGGIYGAASSWFTQIFTLGYSAIEGYTTLLYAR